MSVICSTNCGTIADAVEAYKNSVCKREVRSYGYPYFILIKCDYQFTDIKDTAEWTTAIAANNIRFSPKGTLQLTPPSLTPIESAGDGEVITPLAVYSWNYTTYRADATGTTDYDYWASVFQNQDSYRIMIVDRNQDFTMTDNFAAAILAAGAGAATVTGENPGFEFSFTQPPVPVEGEGSRFQWSTSIQVTKDGVLRAAKLPGVMSVIG